MFISKSQAQDIHFSQIYASPLNLNPAETGIFNAHNRLILNYRNQWASLTVPFKTYSASYDQKLNLPQSWAGILGIGAVINADVAGDANFGIKQAKVSINYQRLSFLSNALDISLGFNAAINQYSLNYSKLHFERIQADNPFETNNMEPNLKNGFLFFDFSFGIRAQYKLKETPIYGGFSTGHINQPKEGFYKMMDDPIQSKFTSYLGSYIKINEQWEINPMIYFFKHSKAQSLNFGAIAKKYLDNPDFKYYFFGIFDRRKDAINFIVGGNYKGLEVGLSYDLTYSSLSTSNARVGAFEIALRYFLYKAFDNTIELKKTCPIFI